ncbi:MAG: Asp-tRNA(Asn)/Glu-tRNA(Gln) amidotransferase subunit GatB [Bacteroidota bacterium]
MSKGSTYQMVIGLEVHIQLNTKTKLFAPDSTAFGAEPNTQTSEISLAHPGTLPILNEKAVESAIKMGVACNCDITRNINFDRKHYFYPDSPFGYQITQQNAPICVAGNISIPLRGEEKSIELEKIHMEADAGKSIHDLHDKFSMVDLNRAGMPLLELVTKPVLSSADEASAFITEIQKIVRFLNIGDGNLEEGSLRCDVNVSLKAPDEKELGQKVEIKNLNSVRYIKKAIEFEYIRQSNLLEAGRKVESESRLFDIVTGKTEGMRGKEEAHDYRYFPEPDLTPYIISDNQFNTIKETMPLLPYALRRKFREEYKLNAQEALVLSNDPQISRILIDIVDEKINPATVAKWLMGPVKSHYNLADKVEFKINSTQLAELIKLVDNNKVTYKNAIEIILPELVENTSVITSNIIAKKGLMVQSDETQLLEIIEEVFALHPKEVKAYKSGKKALLQLFMGQVMKKTRGKADPKTTMKLIQEQLRH